MAPPRSNSHAAVYPNANCRWSLHACCNLHWLMHGKARTRGARAGHRAAQHPVHDLSTPGLVYRPVGPASDGRPPPRGACWQPSGWSDPNVWARNLPLHDSVAAVAADDHVFRDHRWPCPLRPPTPQAPTQTGQFSGWCACPHFRSKFLKHLGNVFFPIPNWSSPSAEASPVASPLAPPVASPLASPLVLIDVPNWCSFACTSGDGTRGEAIGGARSEARGEATSARLIQTNKCHGIVCLHVFENCTVCLF